VESSTKIANHRPFIDELTNQSEESRLNTPLFSQPTTTAFQLALVDLIDSCGLKPAVVVGHSSGEIAAAYCAGYLSHKSAVGVSCFRGVVSSGLSVASKGQWGMASVGISVGQLPQELRDAQGRHPAILDAKQLTVSCVNSPSNITISGLVPMIDVFLDCVTAKGVFCRKLKVDVGYHSAQMDAVTPEYLQYLTELQPLASGPRARMVSTVTAQLLDVDTVCSAQYWVDNMRSPVQFVNAIRACCINRPTDAPTKRLDRSHTQDLLVDGWLELGPHATLKGPLRQTCESIDRSDMFYVSALVRNQAANHTILDAIGQLFCRNVEIDLYQATRVNGDQSRAPCFVVDLPQYSFNHSVTYWEESSRSKTFRSRIHAHHPLLGSQVIDWNPLDAKWSLTLREEDVPWISDHRVHGSMWYPAAGMIAMAIEGVKQLLPDEGFDFELSNVTFAAPIVIGDSEAGTEVQLSVVPKSRAGETRDTDYQFRILLRRGDDEWIEVCDGKISPERLQHTQQDLAQNEGKHKTRKAQIAYQEITKSCQSSLGSRDMYQMVDKNIGVQYGPTFQGLHHIHHDRRGRAHARLRPLDAETTESSGKFTVHPATLDSIFQLAIPAVNVGLKQSSPTLVPSRVTRLWISRDGPLPHPTGEASCEEAVAYARAQRVSQRSVVAEMTVLSSPDTGHIRVQVEELELTEIARDQNTELSAESEKYMCHEMVWKVDPTLIDATEVREYCSKQRSPAPEPCGWYRDMRIMLLGFAQQAFDAMRESDQKPIPSMDKYAAWLRARLGAHSAKNDAPLPSGTTLQKLAEHFERDGHRGFLHALVGHKLQAILTGEIDALQLLFDNPDYMPKLYEELNTTANSFPMLHSYLDLLVHKDPGLRFLEVGAGTGATTSLVLNTIGEPKQAPRYAEYVFTDISNFFLSAAKERFKAYPHIKYRVLDIEKDDSQGPHEEQGCYDIIVAANVFHATKDLSATLRNVRKLLRPDGKLVLMEMTTPQSIETSFIFGTLPGWWLGSEDFRQNSAVVDEHIWDRLLRQVGFSGTEQIYRDWDSEDCHGWSIMISSVTPKPSAVHASQITRLAICPAASPSFILIVEGEKSPIQLETATEVKAALENMSSDFVVAVLDFHEVLSQDVSIADKHCILLTDLDHTHLHDMSPSMFQSYQRIFTACKSITWPHTRNADSQSAPYWAMVEGLARVYRSENPFVRLVTLILETSERAVEHITKVLQATIARSIQGGQVPNVEDEEYMEVSGHLCVNRLRAATYLDQHVLRRTRNPLGLRSFRSGIPLTISIGVHNLLDSIRWVEDEASFKDCLTLLGRVNADEIGSECAGLIVRTGRDVKRLKAGDRVAVGAVGTFRSLVRAREAHAVKIPDSMSFEDAAGIPTAFCTAYYSLYDVARLQKGESVLIHAGAGGTGQAAIQVAQYLDAEIYTTVSSEAKKRLLIERYGIQEDHIFYSRDTSFADGVRRMTAGRGIDVVLNSLSGKLLVASWELIAPFGRFVEIGRKDVDTRGYLPMYPFIRNAQFIGVDLAAIMDTDVGSSRVNCLQAVFDLMADGALRPVHPIQTFPIDQAEHAFRLLVSGKSTGKLVLTSYGNPTVPFKEGDDSEYRFSSQATYVIAGGLGGIGRQLARWLVRRGATSVLLLTRTGNNGNPERQAFIRDMEALGVDIRYGTCDITDYESVQQVLRVAAVTMPPIRGCFQSAMVIQVSTYSEKQGAARSIADKMRNVGQDVCSHEPLRMACKHSTQGPRILESTPPVASWA